MPNDTPQRSHPTSTDILEVTLNAVRQRRPKRRRTHLTAFALISLSAVVLALFSANQRPPHSAQSSSPQSIAAPELAPVVIETITTDEILALDTETPLAVITHADGSRQLYVLSELPHPEGPSDY